MAKVRAFGSSMLEDYLKQSNIIYSIDDEGDYEIHFDHTDDIGCELTVWLISQGDEKSTLRVLASTDRKIPVADWGRTILLCNTWNSENGGPKAYLTMSDEDDENASVDLDVSIDLEPGIHQELLNSFLDAAFAGIWVFWEWAHREHGI